MAEKSHGATGPSTDLKHESLGDSGDARKLGEQGELHESLAASCLIVDGDWSDVPLRVLITSRTERLIKQTAATLLVQRSGYSISELLNEMQQNLPTLRGNAILENVKMIASILKILQTEERQANYDAENISWDADANTFLEVPHGQRVKLSELNEGLLNATSLYLTQFEYNILNKFSSLAVFEVFQNSMLRITSGSKSEKAEAVEGLIVGLVLATLDMIEPSLEELAAVVKPHCPDSIAESLDHIIEVQRQLVDGEHRFADDQQRDEFVARYRSCSTFLIKEHGCFPLKDPEEMVTEFLDPGLELDEVQELINTYTERMQKDRLQKTGLGRLPREQHMVWKQMNSCLADLVTAVTRTDTPRDDTSSEPVEKIEAPQSGKQEISELELEELVRQYHDKARETGHWADYLRDKQEISELDLEELVRQYHDKARQTGQWADYLRSHGGANYLVAINPTKERLRQVYDIEAGWYGGEHPLSFDEHQLLTKKHGEMLMNYRENTKHDFDSMKSKEEALDTEDIFSESNLNRALDFSQQVFSLSRKCTEGFIDFNRSVVESCVKVLDKVGQAPPCSFAVIGLGSVARGEATPYSDLEYAFIVEEDTGTSYFQNLAVESYFRIGNLGETPLKTIGIKCTVASVSTCNIPPVGYRIDGISRRAGHIPTGHPDSNQSLILTVDQLMELYKKEVMSSPDSKRAHDLADLMSSSALIYSYQGGAELYERFLDRRESCEREEVKDNLFAKRKRLDMLSRDITNYSFLPEFDFQQTRNKDVKVKENSFRYPTLLATDLNICLTLNSQYSWNTFTKLHELDILTEEDLRCMHIALALSIYIRTTAYLTRGGQSELLSIHTAVKDTSAVSDRYYVPLNIFLILGCLLVPIKQSFTLALETANSHKFKNASSDIVSKMQSVMNGLKLSRTDFMLRTQILLFAERYQLALNDLYRMVGEDKVANCAKFINVIRDEYHTDKSNPAEKRYLEMLYAMNFQLGEYEVAIEYLSWLTTYVTDSVELAYKKIMIANCLSGLARHRQAKSVANQVLLQMEEALGLDVQQSLIDYIKKKLASEDEFSEHVMACISVTGHAFDALGWSFHGLEQHEHALECFKSSAGIMAGKMINKQFKKKQEMYVCHGGLACEIALSYNNIGNLCNEMGDYKQSLVYYMNALKVSQTVYGGQTNQSGIAMSYSNIGTVYNQMGDYTHSLVYYLKALEMGKAVYAEHNTTSVGRYLVYIYLGIGNLYRSRHQHTEALGLFIPALMIPDKGTSQTATALYGIAQIWVDSHDHKRARQFLHLSMKQSPTSDKLLQARNCHLMGICHLNAGSLSRSWVWLYSALCLHERLPDGVDTEISLAKIHITIATLLLHLFHANIALEHAKKALNISSKLLVRFSGHAECVRVNREAKSLTDSLQLVKIIQNEFPNRV